MTLTGLIIFLMIGAVAGWLAGVIMKEVGFGLVGNIVVGVIGSIRPNTRGQSSEYLFRSQGKRGSHPRPSS